MLHASALPIFNVGDNNTEVLSLFLRLGVNVNEEGGSFGTPLQVAANNGNSEQVRLLLNYGARVTTNVPESRCGTALHAAVASDSFGVVQMLLDKGADLHAKSGIHGTAILAARVYHFFSEDTPVVEFLLRKGANVIDQCEKTGTILQSAINAIPGCPEERLLGVVAILLKHKTDVNAINPKFGTALHVAAYNGYPKMVELLLESGADVKLRGGEYETPLIAASVSMARISLTGWYGHVGRYDCERFENIVRVLLVKGVDVNARSEKHGTALEAVSRGGMKLYNSKKLIKQHTT